MEEFNIVPIYRNGMDEISDGIDIPIPDFCRIHCKENEKCKRYYRELERSNNGIHALLGFQVLYLKAMAIKLYLHV